MTAAWLFLPTAVHGHGPVPECVGVSLPLAWRPVPCGDYIASHDEFRASCHPSGRSLSLYGGTG